MKILIMGLPSTGKTVLALKLSSALNAIHFNAEEVDLILNTLKIRNVYQSN